MLKKSAIALAVAAAIAAPMAQAADSTVYGRVEANLTSEKDNDLSITEASRLGVKGGADLNNGMKAGYKLELSIDDKPDPDTNDFDDSTATPDIGVRQLNVSLSGGFGTVTLGRQSNPYASTYVADQFEKFTGDFVLSSWRFGNALIWSSADMGGMDFYAGAAMDSQGTLATAEDMDATVVGFNGNFSGVGVSAGIVSIADGGSVAEETLTSVGVDYTMGKIYLAGNVETAGEAEIDVVDFAALYDLSGTTKVGVGFSTCDSDTANTKCGSTAAPLAEETRMTMGGYFDMGNNVSTWAEYGSKDEADTNYFQVGMRVKF